jgi:hypothetical protein
MQDQEKQISWGVLQEAHCVKDYIYTIAKHLFIRHLDTVYKFFMAGFGKIYF